MTATLTFLISDLKVNLGVRGLSFYTNKSFSDSQTLAYLPGDSTLRGGFLGDRACTGLWDQGLVTMMLTIPLLGKTGDEGAWDPRLANRPSVQPSMHPGTSRNQGSFLCRLPWPPEKSREVCDIARGPREWP